MLAQIWVKLSINAIKPNIMVFVQFVHFFIMIEADLSWTPHHNFKKLHVTQTWSHLTWHRVKDRDFSSLSCLLCSIAYSPCFIRQLLFTTTHRHCVQGLHIWRCILSYEKKLYETVFIAILRDHTIQMHHLHWKYKTII